MDTIKPKIYFEFVNNVHGRITSEDPVILSSAKKKFSLFVENYFFMPAYRSGRWDGKVHFINKDNFFYLGNFKRIYEYVKSDDYDIVIDERIENYKKTCIDELKNNFLNFVNTFLNPNIIPYKHQILGALKSLYFKRGICEHATSSGKSLTLSMVAYYLYHTYQSEGFRILILVPKIDLVEQLSENMKEFGIPEQVIGKIHGLEKNLEKPIIIATWQSVYKKKEFLKQFRCLIVDECHSLKANIVRSVAESMINAEYRLGFTGTMPDHKANFFLVEGVLGPIIDHISYQELQELKQISNIKIDIIKILYSNDIVQKMKEADYYEERNFIENDEFRNKVIIKIADECIKRNKNVLILAKRIDHCQLLVNMAKKVTHKVFLVTGEVSLKERNDVRQLVEKEGGYIIVATVGVFSTGISIKRLHSIIFASAGKSKIQTLQSVGRGLRLHETKEILNLFDIAENLEFGNDHLNKRIKFYKQNNFEIKLKEISKK